MRLSSLATAALLGTAVLAVNAPLASAQTVSAVTLPTVHVAPMTNQACSPTSQNSPAAAIPSADVANKAAAPSLERAPQQDPGMQPQREDRDDPGRTIVVSVHIINNNDNEAENRNDIKNDSKADNRNDNKADADSKAANRNDNKAENHNASHADSAALAKAHATSVNVLKNHNRKVVKHQRHHCHHEE
ncbi:hypothetical protein ABH925_003586 [Streptacidiphilus sp. EB129]